MKISQAGLDLIKQFEGFRSTSYECQAGVWTIGYGTTGPDIKANQTITAEEAEQLLLQDVYYFEAVVSNSLTVLINQNQFDALVSFVSQSRSRSAII